MNVKFIGCGILNDAAGNEYICDVDGAGTVKSSATGELYKISARDKDGCPTEIEPLSHIVEGAGINRDKLKEYLEDEMILEFASAEECMEYFNTYDGQNFKSVEEMKAYQIQYGFGLDGKWYHISFDEALDVYEKSSLADRIEASQAKAKTVSHKQQENGLAR